MVAYAGLVYSLIEELTPGQLKADDYPRDIDTQALEQWLQEQGVQVHVQDEDKYHYKFRHSRAAPYLYYSMGDHDILNLPLLGIVGPRAMSDYAGEVLEVLFRELAHYHIGTISGLAAGVDTLCHRLSIQHGIPTIAVLGGGICCFLRGRRRALVQEIVAAAGLVVSEFKLKMTPTHWSFPQRNRLIAALCECLYLPEAGEKSGSLITVDDALAMHKVVYGAPQSIFAISSKGLLSYMQAGKVVPVIDISSFVAEVFGQYQKSGQDVTSATPAVELSDDQKAIVQALATYSDGLSLEELVGKVELRTAAVMGALSVLEVYGFVRERGGRWCER